MPKPKGPVQKSVSVQEILNIMDGRVGAKITNSVKSFIYPLKSVMDTRYREYENLTANVIALQTMLMKKGIIDEADFVNEYNAVMNDTIGRVNNDGKMSGYTGVEIYNMEQIT